MRKKEIFVYFLRDRQSFDRNMIDFYSDFTAIIIYNYLFQFQKNKQFFM